MILVAVYLLFGVGTAVAVWLTDDSSRPDQWLRAVNVTLVWPVIWATAAFLGIRLLLERATEDGEVSP